MRRALKWLIAALVAVLLFAIAFVGWYVFGDRVPGKPKLGAATSVSGGPSTPDGSWHVVPGTSVYVGYRIKELFGDAILKRDTVGQTAAVHGTLAITGDHVTNAVVTGDMTKLGSDREARDAYVRDTTLQSAKFPTARFTLTTPITLPAHVAKDAKLTVHASGTLLLHGVTHAITFTLDARWNGPTIEVVGTAPIALADFHIKPPNTVIAKVDGHGSVEIDLTFAPGAH